MTVVVTGANGFLGQHMCRSLLAKGMSVRAIVRGGSPPPLPQAQMVQITSLTERPPLRAAMEGGDVEAVVHLAARVHVMDDRAKDSLALYREANVEGTRVVLEEAIRAGATSFVLASTVKAMGESNDSPWNEDTPPAPADAYGRSKLEAERLVENVAATAGIAATVLRLPVVYGPGMRANFLKLFQLVDRGIPLPFGAIGNARSMIFVGNVVAAIERFILDPRPGFACYLASDGVAVSTPDLIRKIGAALDREVRLVSLPIGVLRALGRLGDVARPLIPLPIGTAQVARLVQSLAVDSTRLESRLDDWPPCSLDNGLRETALWFRASPTT